MLKPNEDQIKYAQNVVASQLPQAAGYRLIVKPLPWSDGLKAGEAEKFGTLAQSGFIAQSSTQTAREDKGSYVGILCHVGEGAYKGESLAGGAWANVGDVVVFNRYAGQRVDIPPGSGDFYHFCNDEDILGKYGVTV